MRWLKAGLPILSLLMLLNGAAEAQNAVTPVFRAQLPEDAVPRTGKHADHFYFYHAGMGEQPERGDGHLQLLIATAQGLINRGESKLYVVWNPRDGIEEDPWPAWLQEEGYIERSTVLTSVEEVLELIPYTRKAVLEDPELPVSRNMATMIASLQNAVVCSPELAEQYGFQVVEDLRNRWTTNVEAHAWAFEHLWPHMNHDVLGYLAPDITASLRDYLITHQVFTFWLSHEDFDRPYADNPAERVVIEKILATAPVNIPVLGYMNHDNGDGLGEPYGVRMLAHYAKYLVAANWSSNLSAFSGINPKRATYTQPAPRQIERDPGKVYAAIVVSDGDNMNTWPFFMRRYVDGPKSASLSYSIPVGPAIIDLMGPVWDYYFEKLVPGQSMPMALGAGYTYPEDYGRAYGEDKDKVWRQYLDIVRRQTERLGMRSAHMTLVDEYHGARFHDVARGVPNLRTVMEGYGRQWWRDAPYAMDNDMVVFHFINEGLGTEETLRDTLETTPKTRPALVCIFLQNWVFHELPLIEELMKKLGDDYVFVTPEELAQLFTDNPLPAQ